MANPLIWLSGAEPDILANFNHDRPKYIGTGSAVLFTSAMAAMSMSFALHMALKAPVLAAIPFGLAWAAGIMSLDRWLVSSMTRTQGMLLAVPRVLLALLFSVVISTPLTLQIFNSEIAQQMSLDHAAAAASFATSPDVTKLQAKVAKDQAAVTSYQGVIASGGAGAATTPGHDPVLASLQSKLTADQSKADYYFKQYHCELYGGCGPGYTVGAGPAATADQNKSNYYQGLVQQDQQNIINERQTLNGNNKTDKARAVSNAQSDLTHAQAQLTADTNALNSLKSDFNVSNTNNTGILARLKALDELRLHNFTMLVAEFVLFLFFAAIELLPVIVKLLLNRGEETQYEKAVAANGVISMMREENVQRTRYLQSVRQQDQEVALSRAAYTAWMTHDLPALAQRTVEAKRRVEWDRIERWERLALEQNRQLVRGWEPSGLTRLRYDPGASGGRRLWWWPGGRAQQPAAPRLVAPAPSPKAIPSGELPKLADPYAPTGTMYPRDGR